MTQKVKTPLFFFDGGNTITASSFKELVEKMKEAEIGFENVDTSTISDCVEKIGSRLCRTFFSDAVVSALVDKDGKFVSDETAMTILRKSMGKEKVYRHSRAFEEVA